jgi:hypothetical protein
MPTARVNVLLKARFKFKGEDDLDRDLGKEHGYVVSFSSFTWAYTGSRRQ